MTSLTTGLDTALGQDRVLVFGALSIALPGYTLRLLDGSGAVVFNSATWVGEDANFGVLAALSAIDDGAGDQAPAINVTLLPPNSTAAATLAAAGMQGSLVSVYAGAINLDTGVPVPDPYLLFIGELDVPTLRSGPDGRSLEYEVVSISERLFSNDEGMRLSDAWHKSVWPGETGLANVTGIEQTVFWGQQAPPGSVVAGSGLYGSSFGQILGNAIRQK